MLSECVVWAFCKAHSGMILYLTLAQVGLVRLGLHLSIHQCQTWHLYSVKSRAKTKIVSTARCPPAGSRHSRFGGDSAFQRAEITLLLLISTARMYSRPRRRASPALSTKVIYFQIVLLQQVCGSTSNACCDFEEQALSVTATLQVCATIMNNLKLRSTAEGVVCIVSTCRR